MPVDDSEEALMETAAKKATFSLSREILEDLDEAVKRGAAPSKNALVERALLKELRELRRREDRQRMEEALKDPLFLRDLEEVEGAFQSADEETARRIG